MAQVEPLTPLFLAHLVGRLRPSPLEEGRAEPVEKEDSRVPSGSALIQGPALLPVGPVDSAPS